MSSNTLNKFYIQDPKTNWYSINVKNIQTNQQITALHSQCLSDARLARGKAIGYAIAGIGALSTMAFIASLTAKIASLIVAIIAFPLCIAPPLYCLATEAGGCAAATYVSWLAVNKFGDDFVKNVKNNWNYSNHLYQQAHIIQLQVPSR